MKIYHNPRCTKSRETLQLIKDSGADVEIIEYLIHPPSEAELSQLLRMLGIDAEQLLRKNEVVFKEKFKGKFFSQEEWITIMVENPKLIERPIIVKGEKAILGRPPENVRALL